VVVGVNRFVSADDSAPPILKIDPKLEVEQAERVRALRGRRNASDVERSLARLGEDAAQDDRNLMPVIVDASRAYATMGEMCEVLRGVWGVWRETPVF
jgi:methylmalonyl-CoA mutase N-terminal domain/subunit